MNRIMVKSRVGTDGVLHVTVPVGLVDANREVQVTVEPVASTHSADEWRQGILETAGKWQGELVRPEQGEFEQRDSLS